MFFKGGEFSKSAVKRPCGCVELLSPDAGDVFFVGHLC